MKGIFLTQEGKSQLEAKIAELEQSSPIDTFEDYTNFGRKQQLREILSSATILPVEKSWGRIIFNGEDEVEAESNYPDGVIIQPKNKI